MLNQSIHFHN